MPARPSTVRNKLLEWYAAQGRHSLPWRKRRSPYRVLVSELMLQQTQVDRVIPYFRNWLKHFPTLKRLAQASETEVLKVWKGLGYYRRAKSLHRLALHLGEHNNFKLPRTRKELEALPGIGPYTAGALLSFAHDMPEAALDTNIKRVITRVFACREDEAESLSLKLFKNASPYEVNSALMDLGALLCTAKKPNCDACPLSRQCIAFKSGKLAKENSSEPAKVNSRRRTKAEFAIAAFREGCKVYLAPKGAILATPIQNNNARASLQKAAREHFAVDIAVRPACAHGDFKGKPASFHRCTLLYGNLEGFVEATTQELNALPRHEREALQTMKLLK